MTVARKMQQFAEKSSWIRKMFEEGAKMKAQFGPDNVFDFSLGNPDVPPPPRFFEVLREVALNDTPGSHAYMPNGGYPYVREALAHRLSAEQGIDIDHGEVLMTCGAAGALNLVMKALLDPGDEVIILAPYFVEYEFYIDNHGGKSRVVSTDTEFNLDLTEIEKALNEKTKIVLINSPNNPTGQIYSRESVERLGRLLENYSERCCSTIYLVSDEPYRKIVFDGHQVPSIFNAYAETFIATSYSKDLSIPGERIGFAAVNPQAQYKNDIIVGLKLANRILGFINAPALMQRVVSCLQGLSVDINEYLRKRDLLCDGLADAGYDFVKPKGSFYLFPRTPIADDVEFVRALQQEKILTVPGSGFKCPGYFRIAFCVSDETIVNAMPGFARVLNKYS